MIIFTLLLTFSSCSNSDPDAYQSDDDRVRAEIRERLEGVSDTSGVASFSFSEDDNNGFVDFTFIDGQLTGQAAFMLNADPDASQKVLVTSFKEGKIDKSKQTVFGLSHFLNSHPQNIARLERGLITSYKSFVNALVQMESNILGNSFNNMNASDKHGTWIEWIVDECLEAESNTHYNKVVHDVYGSLQIGNYNKGKRDGVWVIIYPDHSYELARFDNVKNGKAVVIHADHSFEFGFYRGGLKKGDWRSVNDAGNVAKTRMQFGEDVTDAYTESQADNRAQLKSKSEGTATGYSCDGMKCTNCQQGHYSNGICDFCSAACAERNEAAQAKLEQLNHQTATMKVNESSHADDPFVYDHGETFISTATNVEAIPNEYLSNYLSILTSEDAGLPEIGSNEDIIIGEGLIYQNAAGDIELTNVFGFNREPTVGEYLNVIPSDNLPPIQLQITNTTPRDDLGEGTPQWYEVETKVITDQSYVAISSNYTAVGILYPAQKSPKLLEAGALSDALLPAQIDKSLAKWIFDFDADGNTDGVIYEYCCKDKTTNRDCDYTCGATYVRISGQWTQTNTSQPL